MLTIEATAGTHVSEAAKLVAANAPARCEFNGIEIVARGGESTEQLVATWEAERADRAAAWEASDEGRAYRAQEAKQRWDAQLSVNAALRILPTIDWSDYAQPITWLCEVQSSMDRAGVTFARSAVTEVFRSHGYEPGVFCGEAFDGTSRDIFARWLIGQALDGIERVGAPHSMIRRFAEDWRARFPEGSAQP